MLTSSGTGPISPVGITKISYKTSEKENRVQTAQSGNYDSVSLSSVSGENRFYNELVSRISQDVRTATTTGDIRAISDDIASGQYVIDPMSIASGIMFLWGEA